MNRSLPYYRNYSIFSLALVFLLLAGTLSAEPVRKKRTRGKTHRVTSVKKKKTRTAKSKIKKRTVPAAARGPIIRGGPWTEPTYADSTAGDYVDGEDLEVRRAAVEALGPFNGSVVVVDAATGRILTMVNQKLALGSGFQPCSTIKVSVAMAALSENLVDAGTKVRLYGRTSLDMTKALAHSNNHYFANLGTKLGFEKVRQYARMYGYGEKAGLDIPGENPGRFPSAPPANGGVGMLSSFGEEISQTPLQLAALMTSLANGGTLYYLQYPRTPQEASEFVPRVKRKLDIQHILPQLKPGLHGAVEFGTARRAAQDDLIAGKTGTCTDSRTHLGWFGSFNDVGERRLAVVVLLTGGRPAIGPMAAGIAGDVYRRLSEKQYFANGRPITPPALVSTQICCR